MKRVPTLNENLAGDLKALAQIIDEIQGQARLEMISGDLLNNAAIEIENLRNALNPILDLYSNPGIFPGYHSHLKKELMKDWPELAQAIQHAISLISYGE